MKKSLAANKILERLQSKITPETPTAQLSLIAHARRVVRAIESLESIASNKAPSETAEAHYLRISQNAKKMRAEFTRINDQLHEVLKSDGEIIHGRINRIFEPSKHSAEIRAVLRGMTTEARNKFVLDAVTSANIEALSAVREAPAVLSGLNPDFHGKVIEMAEQKIAPDLVRQLDENFEVFTAAQTVLGVAESMTNEYSDPNKIKDIERREKNAAQAQKDLEESLTNQDLEESLPA
ncbi:hypothetical protein [Nitrosomonas sp.]|uniref:hypothetical protein n=1 Tax=Nitrosomonas sp. TaxID=42353 RepID=UPI002624E25C|nr:hypothetical protein [Nitrosomonas sp.]MCW5602733.1 hypothetical protein [Nitrosomonas sp.]